MGLTEKGYWSSREILGYTDTRQDVNYFIILSDRGRGKSFELKMRLLAWAERGEGFMCLYRTSDDLAEAVETWIDPFIDHLGMDPNRFSWEGDVKRGAVNLLLDEVQIGWFRALTKTNSIKHEYFPDKVLTVWWDEFIPLVDKKLPGIKSQGDAVRTIIKTINHDSVVPRKERGLKPIKCFLVANPFTWDNEILAYFHVDPRVGYGVKRMGPGVIVERLPPIVEEDKGFQTVDNFLGEEVHRQEGWTQMLGYVREVPKGARPFMSVRFVNDFYGVYVTDDGALYVRKKSGHIDVWSVGMDGEMHRVRFGTHMKLQEDEICLEDGRWKERFRKWIYGGSMYYEDPNAKFEFINHVLEMT